MLRNEFKSILTCFIGCSYYSTKEQDKIVISDEEGSNALTSPPRSPVTPPYSPLQQPRAPFSALQPSPFDADDYTMVLHCIYYGTKITISNASCSHVDLPIYPDLKSIALHLSSFVSGELFHLSVCRSDVNFYVYQS